MVLMTIIYVFGTYNLHHAGPILARGNFRDFYQFLRVTYRNTNKNEGLRDSIFSEKIYKICGLIFPNPLANHLFSFCFKVL